MLIASLTVLTCVLYFSAIRQLLTATDRGFKWFTILLPLSMVSSIFTILSVAWEIWTRPGWDRFDTLIGTWGLSVGFAVLCSGLFGISEGPVPTRQNQNQDKNKQESSAS